MLGLSMLQQTLIGKSHLTGIGIHSGKKTTLTFKPASENTGICFVRTDANRTIVPAKISFLAPSKRATCLTKDGVQILTPEHVLAACYALNLHNLVIELDGEEVPIFDGSSKPFLDLFQTIGLKQQTSFAPEPLQIKTAVKITDGNATILGLPDDVFRVTYFLEFPHHFIGIQTKTSVVTPNSFADDIGPARTFGFLSELQGLLEKNLALGGSLENAVVISDTDYLTPLRFEDELARHKILDIIGDFCLLGRPLKGHIIGIRSGHKDNAALVQKLISKPQSTLAL